MRGNRTSKTPELRAPPPVHPRACGEQTLPSSGFDKLAPSGSSPRMRGTVVTSGRSLLPPPANGFIPAYAGNRQLLPRSITGDPLRFIPAYAGNRLRSLQLQWPTIGGRFIPAYAGNRPAAGPPYELLCDRFIPAYAGNRWRSMHIVTDVRLFRFIPAYAGKQALEPEFVQDRRKFGSSPRMRGTGLYGQT